MNSTSVSLLRRLNSGERETAWERFVELYAPLIYYWGRNRGLNAVDAADLVQEVLTILVTKLPDFQYDPRRRFRGWLRTVTSNRAADLYGKARRRPVSGHEKTIVNAAVDAETDLFAEEEYRSFLVNRAMRVMRSEFSEQHWMAVWQHAVEKRKASEVAQNLGMTVNMVYIAKSRILSRLREELEGLVE